MTIPSFSNVANIQGNHLQIVEIKIGYILTEIDSPLFFTSTATFCETINIFMIAPINSCNMASFVNLEDIKYACIALDISPTFSC